MGYKMVIGMICITALGVVQLVKYGDGTTLTACIAAISALAGVEAGKELSKK